MVVQHNLKAMNSNRLLGLTTTAQAKSTEKLSSGYKINRAADDAAGLSISEKMRKQIRGLSQASLNAQDGISSVQTAEGALAEVHDMLQRMNELAVKAANGPNSEDDRQNIQDEITQLKTEIDRVAETTKFNETYLLKGNTIADPIYEFNYKTEIPAEATITNTVYATDGTEFDAGKENDLAAYLEANPKAVLYTSDIKATEAKDDGTDYTIDGDGKITAIDSKVYDINGNEYDDTNLAEANAFLGAGGKFYTANPADDIAENTDFTYTPSSTTALHDVNGNKIAANGLANYFDVEEDGTFKLKDGKTLYTDDKGRTPFVDADRDKYINTTLTGTAALTLSLHVGADATLNNQIELQIAAMDAASIGISNISVTGEDDTNARDAIDTIKFAIQRVSNQRSLLGATQNRLEHTITNLDNVVENTTAAESQIRDTDMAAEMVKYSNSNILTQAGQAMLAQANQSNQGVLSLLQ